MPVVRDKFIKSLGKVSGLLPGRYISQQGPKVILPFYHAISDQRMPHIDPLYEVKSTDQFVLDLDYLLKHYEPIDLPTYLDYLNGTKTITKKSFLLSFDDGLREFHDVIAPILRKKGVPALCFLNSGFIDNKRLFFRYKIALLIDKYEKNNELSKSEKLIHWKKIYNGANQNLRDFLLRIKYGQEIDIANLAKLLGVNFDEFLNVHKPYLSSQQINDLISQGFYFGAHSIDHPEYRLIDEDQQFFQTQSSIDALTRKFNIDYKVFSFPFTDFGVKSSTIRRFKSELNIDGLFGGAGMKEEKEYTHRQRISLERGDMSARQILHAEVLYYRLSRLVGKHVISRQ